MSKQTGGAAFPQPIHHPDLDVYAGSGMTLRDYFAAKALQGLISTADAPCLLGVDGCENETASTAYKLADAMLAARVKP